MLTFIIHVCHAYHIHDLHESKGELHGENLGVVGHRPLHGVVVPQQLPEQKPLVGTLQGCWTRGVGGSSMDVIGQMVECCIRKEEREKRCYKEEAVPGKTRKHRRESNNSKVVLLRGLVDSSKEIWARN